MKRTMFKIKAISLSLLISLLITTGLRAQDKSEYRQALISALTEMGTIKNNADNLDLANKFQRIADKETTEWIPLYYSALCTITYAFKEQDSKKVDMVLDQAQILIDKAIKLKPTESEIWVIQGMLHQARIMVDMMTRGMSYSMKASDAFDKAESLNPENPRIYYLRAHTLLNTPPMYGGGKAAAKPMFQKASEKFQKFSPAEPFAPNWGKNENDQLLKSCDQ